MVFVLYFVNWFLRLLIASCFQEKMQILHSKILLSYMFRIPRPCWDPSQQWMLWILHNKWILHNNENPDREQKSSETINSSFLHVRKQQFHKTRPDNTRVKKSRCLAGAGQKSQSRRLPGAKWRGQPARKQSHPPLEAQNLVSEIREQVRESRLQGP